MPQNQFDPFATGDGANTLAYAAYHVGAYRQQGFQAGVAQSIAFNTFARQVSTVTSALGQFTADNQTQDVLDDGVPANFEIKFGAALKGYLTGYFLTLSNLPPQKIYGATSEGGIKLDGSGNFLLDPINNLNADNRTSLVDGDIIPIGRQSDGALVGSTAAQIYNYVAGKLPNSSGSGSSSSGGYVAPTPASTITFRYGNDSAGVGNNTLATYPLAGLNGSFGAGDANKFTFSQSGLYSITAILQAKINVNNNGAGGPVDTARAYSAFFFYKDGTQLLEFDQAGTAANYVCVNTAVLPLTSYFAAGETVSFASRSTGDGYSSNNTYLGGGTTFTITKIA